jgi:hypothetical protein
MQLSLDTRLLPHAACVTVLMLSVVGCNNSNAAEGAGSAFMADEAKVISYVLVTRMRPEAPEKYFKAARWGYGVCAEVAKSIKHEVIPFPVLRADFVTERIIYASDGKRTMVRKIWYDLDARKMTPENGCELRPVKGWSTALTSDGRQRSGQLDMDGRLHFDTAEGNPEEPVRASRLAMYTQPKRINGVPLKCTVEGSCIVDPTVVLIKEGYSPVLAAYRIDDVATHGTALIVEPVSLTVGKPIDPAIFAVEKGE